MSISIATRGIITPASQAGITYRMRGFDATEDRLVYWNSPTIDGNGDNYTGPGPLSDIVVQATLPPAI